VGIINAQPQNVTTSHAYSYGVTLSDVVNSSVAWQVFQSDGVTPAAGADYTISSSTATNPTITWNGTAAGHTYVVSVDETRFSCSDPTPTTLTVNVLALPALTITTIDDASCSDALATVPLTVNTTNSAAIRYPITVSYSVNGVGAALPITITAGSPTTLTIPAGFSVNATLADVQQKFVITSAKDFLNVSLDITGDVTFIRTVHYTPNTSGITAQ
jgi:hypothetical protein